MLKVQNVFPARDFKSDAWQTVTRLAERVGDLSVSAPKCCKVSTEEKKNTFQHVGLCCISFLNLKAAGSDRIQGYIIHAEYALTVAAPTNPCKSIKYGHG